MMINKNIQSLKQSATLLINEKVKAYRNNGLAISHFGFGQSPFPIHCSIVNALKENAENNHYLPVAGLEKLREQIACFLKNHQEIKTEKEAVFIGPGSKELLYQSILIFEGKFLIPKGSWVSYIPQIQSKGGKYAILETSLENDFKLTSENLDSYFNNKTTTEQHILILNSPNNPTGAVYTDLEYKALSIACKKYNLLVFSDEIYSQLNFSAPFSASISKYYPEKTIVFGGLSKVFSAGGYRLGFMMLPKALKEAENVYKSLFSETFSCVSSPVQFAALKAYEYNLEIQNYVANSSKILKQISQFIYTQFSLINIDCTKAEGAFYMVIGFNNYKKELAKIEITTSTQLANYILENYSFAMLPGVDFGFKNEELFFRIAFVDFDGKQVLNAFEKNTIIDADFIAKYTPNISSGIENVKKFITDLKA